MYKYYWDSGVDAFRHSQHWALGPRKCKHLQEICRIQWRETLKNSSEWNAIDGTVGLYPIQSIIWIDWLTHVKCKIQGGGCVTEYITAPTLPLHPVPSPQAADTNSRTLYQIPRRYQADIYYFWSKYNTHVIVLVLWGFSLSLSNP